VVSVIIATAALRQGREALRRTSQPVVLVHEVSSDIADRGEGIDYRVYLRNHGIGAALNVRFGVELVGARYPYTFGTGVERGARQLVEAGGRVPEDGDLKVKTAWDPYIIGEGVAGETRVFWARFENAFGETWQTTNPHDPSGDTTFEHVRRRELRRRETEERERRLEIERQVQEGDAALRADLDR
jgi:hypothetical protein